jgi:magnesium transporter
MARSPSDGPAALSSAAANTIDSTAMPRAASAGQPAATTQPAGAPAPTPTPTPAEGVVRLVVVEGGSHREFEGEAAIAELPKAMRRRAARLWINVGGADRQLKDRISESLELHPLLAEDIAERDQRAKLEQVGDLLHVVLYSLGFEDGTVYERELDFVLGERFLLSNHSTWWDPRVTRHLRVGPAEVLAKGTGHLLWCLADDVIDGYFPILDQLGDEIDDLEDQVVGRADRALLERLFYLKRQLIQVRRVTSPEREMFNILSSREEKAIPPEERLYFRDAYDHLIRLTDELDTYRELASATLEAYLSTVNNNLSLIMKRLTGVTVVVAGVGAIGGIFGMSEAQTAWRLDEGFGFWFVTFGSLVLAGLAAAVLHKMDWI